MRSDAVVIEVALNETVGPAQHPKVPRSPEECAADALRCGDAGAAVVHWHAVDDSGAQRLADAALYGRALDAIGSAVLAYPSNPIDVEDTVEARLAHCLALRESHGMELAPVDVATANLVLFDADRSIIAPLTPTPGYDVIRNSLPFVAEALASYRRVGLTPTVASFDLGSTRTIAALIRAGLLSQTALVKIFLWGAPMIGPEPSVAALDLHLAHLPDDLDVEWLVVPYGVDDPGLVEELARAALDRGGGVRVGIGDNPVAFADLDNAGIVEVAAAWAADAGRPIASAADLRDRLGLAART